LDEFRDQLRPSASTTFPSA